MPRITITVPETNAQPYRFPLDREVVTLGRGSENDVIIDSGSVSVQHAEMRRIPGGYELHDVGSTNGITLGEDSYSFIPLHNGMSAKIGDIAFDFLLNDEELGILTHEKSANTKISPALVSLTPASAAAPAVVTNSVPKANSYIPVRNSGGGSGAMLVFLIFAIVAFFAGLAVRYQKETGGSLSAAVQAKFFPTAPVK
jgi:pSer/pThr/pTyr-binding forkhead associated (FHA) protein